MVKGGTLVMLFLSLILSACFKPEFNAKVSFNQIRKPMFTLAQTILTNQSSLYDKFPDSGDSAFSTAVIDTSRLEKYSGKWLVADTLLANMKSADVIAIIIRSNGIILFTIKDEEHFFQSTRYQWCYSPEPIQPDKIYHYKLDTLINVDTPNWYYLTTTTNSLP